jgi:hypothetical protein
MNWGAIGAVGEVVGAIAVVITLLYLAIQIRLNTKVARATIRQELAKADQKSSLLKRNSNSGINELSDDTEKSKVSTQSLSSPKSETPESNDKSEDEKLYGPTNYYKKCISCGESCLVDQVHVESEGIPHDEPGHRVAFSTEIIMHCESCGCSQLERYSHDCWSHTEPWEMFWWYGFEPSSVEHLQQLMANCETPLDAHCICDAHNEIRRLLSSVYGGATDARKGEEAKEFAWLRLELDEAENIVKILVDKSKGSCSVAE